MVERSYASIEVLSTEKKIGPESESLIRINDAVNIQPEARQKIYKLAYRFSKRMGINNCSYSGLPFVGEVSSNSTISHALEHIAIGILYMNGYRDLGGLNQPFKDLQDHFNVRVTWGSINSHREAPLEDTRRALSRAASVINRTLAK